MIKVKVKLYSYEWGMIIEALRNESRRDSQDYPVLAASEAALAAELNRKLARHWAQGEED